jgi:hypothetical protein
MEERRKIVIPIGSKPETPHFDAEETLLSARPVVPIGTVENAEVFNGTRGPARAPFYKRPAFLSLVVVAAVGIGLVAGLGIARYRYTQATAAPVVAQPVQAPVGDDTRTATIQPPKDNQQAQVPTLPDVETEENTTSDDSVAEDNDKPDKPEAKTKAPESSADRSVGDDNDEEETVMPSSRGRRRTRDDEEMEDDSVRSQRRARRVRDRDEDTIDIPRRVERASEQINRIREIFEGRQRP